MEARIATVSQEIEQLKQEVARVEDFKNKAQVLEKKIGVIKDLQARRVGPAKMLDDLAAIINDQRKIWLSKVTEGGGKLVLEGGAMEHENISDFQLALERRSKFFSNVILGLVRTVERGGATPISSGS